MTSGHDLPPGDLQVPHPSPPWDTSAVPPDGALFSPHGYAYPPDHAPFAREDAASARDDAGFPAVGSAGAPGSVGYPRGAAPPARGAAPPPASSSTDLAWPDGYPAAASARPAADAPPAAAAPASPGTETARFTAGDFAQSWMDDVGFSPQWEPSASPLPAADAGPAAGAPEHHQRLLTAGLFALVTAVLVVPALLIAHSFHGLTGGASAAARSTTKQPARGATAAAPSQRAAAASLATLLAQTAADRSSIVNAVGAVEHCTAALGQAPEVFRNSATSRERLLRQLATLPGRSALPAAMLQALTGAWQASAAVDTDLGKWAQDEAADGCKPNDHADANYEASNAPDVQATNDKAAFVGMWNVIAAKYGLARYQTSQL